MANKKLNVAIIGLGATGAFAARAAYDMGCDVKIYVHGTANTTPPGAFWLHWLPDDVTGTFTSEPILIRGLGKEAKYIKLQWGAKSHGVTSSFPTQPVTEQGYNPATVLPQLVPAECELVPMPYKLSDTDVRNLAMGYDVVFQTFPKQEHVESQPALIPYVAAAKMGFTPLTMFRNVVVYNGSGKTIVVREAQLFGNHYLEFPKGMSTTQVTAEYDLTGYQTVVLRDIDPTTVPVEQDPMDKIQLVGRFATWNRHALSHHAYHEVQRVLSGVVG